MKRNKNECVNCGCDTLLITNRCFKKNLGFFCDQFCLEDYIKTEKAVNERINNQLESDNGTK